MNLIDTHCHVDMYANPLNIVKESEQMGIFTIGMTNLPSHFQKGYLHVKNFKKTQLALGMHPLMANNHSKEFPLFYKMINKTSYIGEIGLDFSRHGLSTKEQQISSFKKILEAVHNKPKILSIHSRKAEKEVLQLLKEFEIENAIFHWYSGGVRLIDQIVSSGYFFSVNPSMLKSNSGKKIIKRIPKNFLLTESDGPYIEIENRIIKPNDVRIVLNHLSKLNNSSFEIETQNIQSNFQRLIKRIKG